MASSRWKRFAFFDKHSLSVPSEVFHNLVPCTDVYDNVVDGVSPTHRSAPGSGHPEQKWNDVAMVTTTAALPFETLPPDMLPVLSMKGEPETAVTSNDELGALAAMWTTLSACEFPRLASGGGQLATVATIESVTLPSQAEVLSRTDGSAAAQSGGTCEGLVLVFVTSRATGLVHCLDVTVRCNPPETTSNWQDLDGWRGYFSPFEHGSNSSNRSDSEKIVGLAAYRSHDGHKPLHLACISTHQVCVWENPHLQLSSRLPLQPVVPAKLATRLLLDLGTSSRDGKACTLDIAQGILAVGTDTGVVLLCIYESILTVERSGPVGTTKKNGMYQYAKIPAPPGEAVTVASVKISHPQQRDRKVSVFVAYGRSEDSQAASTVGICCYDVPSPGMNTSSLAAPAARHDLDGRHVAKSDLCDAVATPEGLFFSVARNDGLFTYSQIQKISVVPVDGVKHSICVVPRPPQLPRVHDGCGQGRVGSSYFLVASTDAKSGRDSIDIYDSVNRLVGYHMLLSPGQRAVKSAGIAASPTRAADGSVRVRRSAAVVLTSGGTILCLTEKITEQKVSLLVQRNLFAAAISVAHSDTALEPSEIGDLYRKHAEHLYRKGDYSASIEQYIHTVGSLEPSHVVFRFLDKIPLLAQYLQVVIARNLATPVHYELLKTCYLKLNDPEAADVIGTSTSASLVKESLLSLSRFLSSDPRAALATIYSLEAREAAEVLVLHGTTLARVAPREAAGLVIALCAGTYSPTTIAETAAEVWSTANKMLGAVPDARAKTCVQFPVRFFSSSFIDNPKMLRLILAHCNRNKCHLTPSLRRTLLELSLDEWKQAKRVCDTEACSVRHREVTASLTDSHCHEIGDYDALVVVQKVSFEAGELLLYERLQKSELLLSRYARDASEKSRRQMVAMSRADPEVLAEVLGHFVSIGGDKLFEASSNDGIDDGSEDGFSQVLDDINETLEIAHGQGQVAPVRVARILAGEGTEQFSRELFDTVEGFAKGEQAVPLSVALEYVGSILDGSRKEINRLRSEIQEYNHLCNSIETEVLSLWQESQAAVLSKATPLRMNIDGVYSKVRSPLDSLCVNEERTYQSREAFWRELSQSDDSFGTITRFFGKSAM